MISLARTRLPSTAAGLPSHCPALVCDSAFQTRLPPEGLSAAEARDCEFGEENILPMLSKISVTAPFADSTSVAALLAWVLRASGLAKVCTTWLAIWQVFLNMLFNCWSLFWKSSMILPSWGLMLSMASLNSAPAALAAICRNSAASWSALMNENEPP